MVSPCQGSCGLRRRRIGSGCLYSIRRQYHTGIPMPSQSLGAKTSCLDPEAYIHPKTCELPARIDESFHRLSLSLLPGSYANYKRSERLSIHYYHGVHRINTMLVQFVHPAVPVHWSGWWLHKRKTHASWQDMVENYWPNNLYKLRSLWVTSSRA